MKALSKLFRKTDSTWVRPWEDRDTPDFKKWSSTSLAWAIYVNNKPHGNVRKFWNQTLNHRTIALLAINARFNNLPDFVVVHCNRKQLKNIVTSTMVNGLCKSGKDTLLNIIKDGIDRKDLCQIENPPGYKGICFTGGTSLMKAYATKEKDGEVIEKLSQSI